MSVFGSRAGIAHIPPGRALGVRPLVLTLVARIAKGPSEFNGAPVMPRSLLPQFRSVACGSGAVMDQPAVRASARSACGYDLKDIEADDCWSI